MLTFNIIMAVVLIVLSVINLICINRYTKKNANLEKREAELNNNIDILNKRSQELGMKDAMVAEHARRLNEYENRRKKIYANFEVLDSDENKPTMKAIGKSLSSKIGYALRKEFPKITEHRDSAKGGRTIYSVDVYVAPFEMDDDE